MNNDKINNKDENKKIEVINDKVVTEPEDVTREINLDDLYDGSINNTVIIDPVTNKEVLLSSKKPNYTLLFIILAVLSLLVLYYVNNKTELGSSVTEVKPKTTTIKKTTIKKEDTGELSCSYEAKSDAETQNVSYKLVYEDGKLNYSEFEFIGTSNIEGESAIIDDLKKQYETFFINNSSTNSNIINFEKTSSGFTFKVRTDYQKEGFDNLIISENTVVLFAKPSKEDTVESLKTSYSNKGYTCLANSVKEE